MPSKYQTKADTSGGELDSLASPHITTAGDLCQTASLFLCMSEKHPVVEKSEGEERRDWRAREDHMLQSSSTLFMNLCPDEAPEGSGF